MPCRLITIQCHNPLIRLRVVRPRNAPRRVCIAAFAFLLAACGGSSTGPVDHIVAGVNLTQLFAAPDAAEEQAVLDMWAARSISAADVSVAATVGVTLGETAATLRVVSHTVDGALHYGVIAVPDGAADVSLPVLVYTHESDNGLNLDQLLPFVSFAIGSLSDRFVFVAPSFRAEPLVVDGVTYRSSGEPSPWDRDVDDALALLNVALATTPAADPERIGILGFSRGATVGMLMAIRDPRIDLAVAYYGPTDFLGEFVQDLTEDALAGNPRNLPGVDYLNSTLIQPLKDGDSTISAVRAALIRRSPVYFADRLPQLQIHHGRADSVVPVGEAERLIAVMTDLGRVAPEFEAHLYANGSHSPLSMFSSLGRTRSFLERLLVPAVVARHSVLVR